MPPSPRTPPARRAQEGPRFPNADDSHSDVFERPTISPPFDLEEFARVKMGQTEERLSLPDTPTLSPPDSGMRDRLELTAADDGEQALLARLGSLERVATLAVDARELRALPVDHRGAFLLSQVDVVSTLAMILDVSGMSRLDALRILAGFVEQGTITLD
jgi:hypothetical protein